MSTSLRALLFVALFLLPTLVTAEPLNAVLGDASWIARHGVRPTEDNSEVERIRTHLGYVIDLLEQADTSHLSDAQRSRRATALEGLQGYADAGMFPRRATDDGYGVRRPRFIDDRGVHCAVGELIRLSGDAELAQEIDDVWEFAFVPQIGSDAMLVWAKDHGFTVNELAMIQPTYSAPPSKRSVVAEITGMKDALTLGCARSNRVTKHVKLTVRGTKSGDVSVQLRGKSTPFSECFHKELTKRHFGGGAWDSEPKPFSTTLKLDITAPEELIASRFERFQPGSSSGCTPRPGPLSRTALIRYRSNRKRVLVEVRTEPNNDEVNRCLRETFEAGFRDIIGKGTWNVDLRAEKDLGVSTTSARLDHIIPHYAKHSGAVCFAKGAPAKLSVKVSADPTTQRFTIGVDGGTPEFRKCAEETLRERLRSDFTVPRKLQNGDYEQYFRIDAAAKSKTHVVVIESPEAQRKRKKEQRRRFDEPF